MKAFTRALCSALVTVGLLGVAGCGPDNEAESEQLAKKAGDPGAPAAGSKSEAVVPPPKTQQEHFQRTAADPDYMKKKDSLKKK